MQKREFFIGLPTEIAPTPKDILNIVEQSVLHTRTEREGGGMLRYRAGRIELFDDPYCNRYGTFEYARIGIVDTRVHKVLHSCGIEAVVLDDHPLEKIK